MNDICGYIGVEDAERLRGIKVIAFDLVAEDNENTDEFLTSSEAKAKPSFRSKNEEDDWPELVDLRNGVMTVVQDDDSDTDQTNKKNRSRLGSSSSRPRPSPIEDEEDLFENNSELKAVIKVYFSPTKGAQIPCWVDIDQLNPKKYKHFEEHMLIVYEPDDFIMDDPGSYWDS